MLLHKIPLVACGMVVAPCGVRQIHHAHSETRIWGGIRHDDIVRACFGSLLNVDVAHVPRFAQMNFPSHVGGLNTVAIVKERHPEIATFLVEEFPLR